MTAHSFDRLRMTPPRVVTLSNVTLSGVEGEVEGVGKQP